MATFPYGYGKETVTVEQQRAKKTFRLLHPEVRRRFEALQAHLAKLGVPLGVGTGWRVQPSDGRPGFAKPGNSYHESFPASTENANAMAIDTVPSSSWARMELVLNQFGFRSFRNVNNEPWHIQPVEIPGGRRYATTAPPLKTWKLPGDPPPAQTVPPIKVSPAIPKPTIKRGTEGLPARQMIDILKFWKWYPAEHMGDVNDGKIGARGELGIKNMQRSLGVGADGIYGPQSYAALSKFVTVAKTG